MPFLRLECPTTWIVQEGEWDPARNAAQESVFTLSNGYLGIRGYPEEPFDAGPTRPAIHIAGIFDRGPDGAPEMVEITNFLAVEIQLGGLPFRLGAGNVSHYSRVLGLKRGILQRSLVYTEGGRSTRLEFERFVSLSNLHVVGQSITVTPLDWRGEIVVRLWLDARGDSRVRRSLKLVHAEHMGRDRLLMATQTEASLLRIAHACRCSSWVHQGSPARPHLIGQGDRIGFELMTTLEPGQQAAFERLISTYTSRDPDTDSVERGCLDDVRGTEGGAYGVRRRLHVQALQRRWEHANIEIEGPEEDQRAVRFAVFQLMQHAPPRDLAVSIGARGLSGDGHGGCISWGTELAMLPFFASTNPPAARQLLRYRTATLEGAKRNAQAIGCQGALFAWESADTGDEAGPGLAAGVQPHVDAAVAYAAWQYFEATGDTALRERELLTLAVGTARFWASRVTSNPARKGYDIRAVSGPDETGEPVDNSAYTNFMAAWNLRLAVQEVDRMRRTHRRSRLLGEFGVTKEETLRWTAIADSLYLPAPSPEGVWEQYEGFLVRAAPRPAAVARACRAWARRHAAAG